MGIELTIGMATYNDYEGVYFTLQRRVTSTKSFARLEGAACACRGCAGCTASAKQFPFRCTWKIYFVTTFSGTPNLAWISSRYSRTFPNTCLGRA